MLSVDHLTDLRQSLYHRPERSHSESAKILSGMLLNHCLTYGPIQDEELIASTIETLSPTEIALLVFKFSNQVLSIKAQVSAANLQKFLNSSNAVVSPENVLWLHLTTLSALSQLIDHYKLPSKLFTLFSDSSVYTRSIDYKEQGYVLHMVTTNMQDDIVNVKKLHMFLNSGLLITFEQRIHAVVDGLGSDRTDKLYTAFNPIGLTLRGTSLTVGSELNLSSLGTGEQYSTGPSDFRQSSSKDLLFNGTVSGIFLDTIMSQIEKEEVRRSICSHGVSCLFIEIAQAMLKIALPVIAAHAKEMLVLHDAVFLKERKPDHLEGLYYIDQIEMFKRSYGLLYFILDQAHVFIESIPIKTSQEGWVAPHEMAARLNWATSSDMAPPTNLAAPQSRPFGPFPALQVESYQKEEILHGYHRALNQLQTLQSELERINRNLRELITRRNDRVNLMLTIVATTFLPLTFITGVFGMNFSKGGGLVYILEVDNGSYAFLVICILSIIVLFMWFFAEGFFDMLASKEVNKHVTALQKQQSTLHQSKGSRKSFTLTPRRSPNSNSSRPETPNIVPYMARPVSRLSSAMSEPLVAS